MKAASPAALARHGSDTPGQDGGSTNRAPRANIDAIIALATPSNAPNTNPLPSDCSDGSETLPRLRRTDAGSQ